MNNYPYVIKMGEYAGRTPPKTYSSGAAKSDAIIQQMCPKCGAQPGFYCETPVGRIARSPHSARIVLKKIHQLDEFKIVHLFRPAIPTLPKDIK